MSKYGNIYSEYYDLLYKDKDYTGEVTYIDDIIKNSHKNSKTILDMGCGTGRHAELLCDKGYNVHGIDLSEGMLKVAETRRKGKESKLKFTHSNISELNLSKKFDVIISLFHVMSYQASNKELVKAFEVAKKHLNKDGIFIFDFWYGPAVLTNLPNTRIKKLENESIKVTKLSESVLNAQTNTVDVNYDIFIQNKKTEEMEEINELHRLRYFFDTELEVICSQLEFKIEKKFEWLKHKNPDFQSWIALWVIKKVT